MSNKSNALWKYLQAQGALEAGNEKHLPEYLKDYRRQYKREWLKNKRKQCKEVKIYLTADQYRALADHAKIFGIRSITGYAKEVLLSAQQPGELIPRKAELQRILQEVGMAIMQLPKDSEACPLLIEAEETLLNYLNN